MRSLLILSALVLVTVFGVLNTPADGQCNGGSCSVGARLRSRPIARPVMRAPASNARSVRVGVGSISRRRDGERRAPVRNTGRAVLRAAGRLLFGGC